MNLFPPDAQQGGALPFVNLAGNIRIMLVSSRRRGRWGVPKGWAQKEETLVAAAEREAAEEAGVDGTAAELPLGRYAYDKKMPEGYALRCEVVVFPLLVRSQAETWSEDSTRVRRWCDLGEASELVDDRSLGKLLADCSGDVAEHLRGFAAHHPEPSILLSTQVVPPHGVSRP